MIPVHDWPAGTFRVKSEDWHLVTGRPRPPGLFGQATRIFVENRFWRVPVDLSVLTEDEMREVRALLDKVRGTYAEVRVPVETIAPIAARHRETATFDDDVTFDGDVVFAEEVAQNGQVLADAPASATKLRTNLSGLGARAMFSLPGDKVYAVSGYDGNDLLIEPPLRAAVTAGTHIEVLNPVARMCFDQESPSLPRVMGGYSQPTMLQMVEAL
jgi:copper chaperone CopZ